MKPLHVLSNSIRLALCLATLPVGVYAQTTDALPAAIEYLRAHATEAPEWTVLALRAAGVSTEGIAVSSATTGETTDIARRILALSAIGRDPRPLAAVLETQMVNGSMNDDLYLNDDVFAVLAFRAAGRTPHTEPIPTITEVIINAQRADGGWGVTTLSRSDVDSTAAAVQALAGISGTEEAVKQALAYLRTQQNADGGFPFRVPFPTNSASTAWTLSTLAVLGIDAATWSMDGNDPRTALQTFQQSDGGFGWQMITPESTPLLTSYAVLALADRGFIVATFTPPSDSPPDEDSTPDDEPPDDPPTDPPPDEDPPPDDEPPADEDPLPGDPPTDEQPGGPPPSDDEPVSTSEETQQPQDTKQKRDRDSVKRPAADPHPSQPAPLSPTHVQRPSPTLVRGETNESRLPVLPDVPASTTEPSPTPQIAGVTDVRPFRTLDRRARLEPYRDQTEAWWIMAGLGLLAVTFSGLLLSWTRRRV